MQMVSKQEGDLSSMAQAWTEIDFAWLSRLSHGYLGRPKLTTNKLTSLNRSDLNFGLISHDDFNLDMVG